MDYLAEITKDLDAELFDPDTGLTINATADVSFALIKTGQNAKSAWISGEQVFKYDNEG